MVMHVGGWGIFAVGGLFLTLTAGVLVMQNQFFLPKPSIRNYRLGVYLETHT